ncbi:MAG: glycosyl hydrolase family 65 protein [Planctomycetota bacterium]
MPDCLRVAPGLPKKWKRLELSIKYRGLRLRFRITPKHLSIKADARGPAVTLNVLGKRRKLKAGGRVERKLG